MATVNAAATSTLGQTGKCAELSGDRGPFLGSLRLVHNADPSPCSLRLNGCGSALTSTLAGGPSSSTASAADFAPALAHRHQRHRSLLRRGSQVHGDGGLSASLCGKCMAMAANLDNRHSIRLLASQLRKRGSVVLVRAMGEDGGSSDQPKGFGTPPKPPRNPKSDNKAVATTTSDRRGAKNVARAEDDDDDDGGYNAYWPDEEDDSIPEVVNKRMMNRVGVLVGLPVLAGIAFFPFYYFLKTFYSLEVPYWLPFVTSLFTFGSAGLGISYGILSTSWDPNREGTFLGWKELQANWPAFMQSIRGGKKKR